jgi:hypothetical protein
MFSSEYGASGPKLTVPVCAENIEKRKDEIDFECDRASMKRRLLHEQLGEEVKIKMREDV